MSFLFGGFDPNKIKPNLKMACKRMQLDKNKRTATLRSRKREVIGHLSEGKEELARIKVESIIREEELLSAYDILEVICELIHERMVKKSNIPMIRTTAECPSELRTSVQTVIYCSNRLDIPELNTVRDQLRHKYGREFIEKATTNADQLVDPRIVEKLSVQPPTSFRVDSFLKDLADENGVDWSPPTPVEPPNEEPPFVVHQSMPFPQHFIPMSTSMPMQMPGNPAISGSFVPAAILTPYYSVEQPIQPSFIPQPQTQPSFMPQPQIQPSVMPVAKSNWAPNSSKSISIDSLTSMQSNQTNLGYGQKPQGNDGMSYVQLSDTPSEYKPSLPHGTYRPPNASEQRIITPESLPKEEENRSVESKTDVEKSSLTTDGRTTSYEDLKKRFDTLFIE